MPPQFGRSVPGPAVYDIHDLIVTPVVHVAAPCR
jgi:hypothetical protein